MIFSWNNVCLQGCRHLSPFIFYDQTQHAENIFSSLLRWYLLACNETTMMLAMKIKRNKKQFSRSLGGNQTGC